MSKPKKKGPRPTDCEHGMVANGCTVSFTLHICQPCARQLLVDEILEPRLVPIKRAALEGRG